MTERDRHETRPFWSAASAQGVLSRIVVELDWVLTVPAHPGDGDGEGGEADAVVLRDPVTGGPLLTGEGLAGALRRYLRVREGGTRWAPADAPMPAETPGSDATPPAAHVLLLGDDFGGRAERPSALLVDDALSPGTGGGDGEVAVPEWRMSVGMEAATRARAGGRLFSMEAWPAGTRFALRFELEVAPPRTDGALDVERLRALGYETVAGYEAGLRRALAAVVEGLDGGGVRVGAKTRRGFGRGVVRGARVRRYDLCARGPRDGLVDWLRWGAAALADHPSEALDVDVQDEGAGGEVARWLLDGGEPLGDRRRRAVLTMGLRPWSSLLMGGGEGPADATQFRAAHGEAGTVTEVARGTGLAGPLRARALRVARALAASAGAADRAAEVWRDDLFGWADERPDPSGRVASRASRVLVDEAGLEGVRTGWLQAHVAIDSFLGGALPQKLFFEEPALAGAAARLPLSLEVEEATRADVGLLLLAVRDAWALDLAFGHGEAIGRGRQVGVVAAVRYEGPDGSEAYRLEIHPEGGAYPDRYRVGVSGSGGDADEAARKLNDFVAAAAAHLHPTTP